MNSNLKALQLESDDNNSGKDGIDDGEDDFKQLVQELNKEEGLDELVQQTLAKILETVWHNPQFYEKIKDKKRNKEIWPAHSHPERAKDLRFREIQTAVLKDTIFITQFTNDLVKLKSNRQLTAKDIRKSIFPVFQTCT